jgi:hypothetical protein
MNSFESIPQVWDDERDGQFFHLTASVFPPAFCCGATVLLASYDADDELAATTVTADLPVPAQPASFVETSTTVEGAAR